MTRVQCRTLLTLMLVEILVAYLAVTRISVNTGNDVVPPGGVATEAIGPISTGNAIRQEVPTTGGTLSSVSLLLATYKRVNQGEARLIIEVQRADKQWYTVWTQTADKAQLKDNEPWVIVFSPPLTLGPAQRIAFTLQSDGTEDQGIAWWSNGQLQREGFRLSLNNRPIAGVAHLTVRYESPSGPLWAMIPTIWQRVTIFLNPFWRAVLPGGIACLILAPLLLIRRSG